MPININEKKKKKLQDLLMLTLCQIMGALKQACNRFESLGEWNTNVPGNTSPL